MDENKRKKLQEIGYFIGPICGLCKNGVFPNNEWGTCKIFSYKHLKHSDEIRQLSIHKYGSCGEAIGFSEYAVHFKFDESKRAFIENFKEFWRDP